MPLIHSEDDVILDELLKAGELGFEFVAADRHREKAILTAAVGNRRLLKAGLDIGGCHFDLRDRCGRFVCGATEDGRGDVGSQKVYEDKTDK